MKDYWKEYNFVPWKSNQENPNNAVYIILFFEKHRALLLRKDLTIYRDFETRKVKKLLTCSNIKVTTKLNYVSLGERPINYPKEATVGFWIDGNI